MFPTQKIHIHLLENSNHAITPMNNHIQNYLKLASPLSPYPSANTFQGKAEKHVVYIPFVK